MDYRPKLLKCGFGTLLGSLIVVALLALPGRVNGAESTSGSGLQAVSATLNWGPGPGALLDGPSDH